jgi:hypothetical protein
MKSRLLVLKSAIQNPKSKIQNPKSGDPHSVEDPADDLLGNVFSNLDFGFVLWLR